MRKPIYVLGTGLSHDGSACLLKDGRVCVAIEKERLTRVKHDGGNDSAAIQYCLDAEGIRMSDIALIVQNANFGMFERGSSRYRGKRLITDSMPVVTISHHLAHAYSAFAASPFDSASVFVVDGCGNGLDECMDLDGAIIPDRPSEELASLYFEKDSYYEFSLSGRRSIFKDFSMYGMGQKEYPMYPKFTRDSIGGLYAAASVYAFNGIDDSGKLMGLAPYGRAGAFDFRVFDLRDGRVFVRYDWMKDFRSPAYSYDEFKANFQYYADIAYLIQREVERALLYQVEHRYQLCPSENLCYSGGVALNAVANSRIIREGPFRNVYIQPAAGDNGLALGCAYYGWLAVLGKEKAPHSGVTRFGRIYPAADIEGAIQRRERYIVGIRSANVVEETADLLASGRTVGWFQDWSEFGPRALGGRSILADPRDAGIRDHINMRIKFREDFRPFAPAVLLEEASRFFDWHVESPYMLVVVPVRQEWHERIPGAVHKNGSARIQTVTAESDPLFYRLLCAFRERTGLGLILNTSFNRRTMPIVERPEEALDFFLACGLDVLAMGEFIVRKREISETAGDQVANVFEVSVRERLGQRRLDAVHLGGVYQFSINCVQHWTLDLSQGHIALEAGRPVREPDAVIEIPEAHLRTMLDAPFEAFCLIESGQIRVSGNRDKARGLAAVLGVV